MARFDYPALEEILFRNYSTRYGKAEFSKALLGSSSGGGGSHLTDNIADTDLSQISSRKRNVMRFVRETYLSEISSVKKAFEMYGLAISSFPTEREIKEGIFKSIKADDSVPPTVVKFFQRKMDMGSYSEFMAEAVVYALTRFVLPETEDKGMDASPTESNIEYSSNDCYIDRNNLHKKIHSLFASGVKIVTITGLGGVGKSTLANKYGEVYEQEYDFIRLINAETKESLERSAVALLDRKIGDYNRGNSDVIQEEFRNWFSRGAEWNRGWLLIFDNVEDFNLVLPYVPKSDKGRNLFTTRDKFSFDWLGGKALELDCFDPKDAKDFLLRRTKSSDKTGAEQLALRLGYLPLALEHAASYICMVMPETDFAKYISYLDDKGLEALEPHGVRYNDEERHRRTVRTTWNISMEKIGRDDARQLLTILAYLAPEDILFSQIIVARGFHKRGCMTLLDKSLQDEYERDLILYELTRYSLIQYNKGTGKISIHRLLQEVIRKTTEFDIALFRVLVGSFRIEEATCLLPEISGKDEFNQAYTDFYEHMYVLSRHLIDATNSDEDGIYCYEMGLFLNKLAFINLRCDPLTERNLEHVLDVSKIALDMYGRSLCVLSQRYDPYVKNNWEQAIKTFSAVLSMIDQPLYTKEDLYRKRQDGIPFEEVFTHIHAYLKTFDQSVCTGIFYTFSNIAQVLEKQGRLSESLEYKGKCLITLCEKIWIFCAGYNDDTEFEVEFTTSKVAWYKDCLKKTVSEIKCLHARVKKQELGGAHNDFAGNHYEDLGRLPLNHAETIEKNATDTLNVFELALEMYLRLDFRICDSDYLLEWNRHLKEMEDLIRCLWTKIKRCESECCKIKPPQFNATATLCLLCCKDVECNWNDHFTTGDLNTICAPSPSTAASTTARTSR